MRRVISRGHVHENRLDLATPINHTPAPCTNNRAILHVGKGCHAQQQAHTYIKSSLQAQGVCAYRIQLRSGQWWCEIVYIVLCNVSLKIENPYNVMYMYTLDAWWWILKIHPNNCTEQHPSMYKNYIDKEGGKTQTPHADWHTNNNYKNQLFNKWVNLSVYNIFIIVNMHTIITITTWYSSSRIWSTVIISFNPITCGGY